MQSKKHMNEKYGQNQHKVASKSDLQNRLQYPMASQSLRKAVPRIGTGHSQPQHPNNDESNNSVSADQQQDAQSHKQGPKKKTYVYCIDTN